MWGVDKGEYCGFRDCQETYLIKQFPYPSPSFDPIHIGDGWQQTVLHHVIAALIGRVYTTTTTTPLGVLTIEGTASGQLHFTI